MRHFKLLLTIIFVTIPFLSSAKKDKNKKEDTETYQDSIVKLNDSIVRLNNTQLNLANEANQLKRELTSSKDTIKQYQDSTKALKQELDSLKKGYDEALIVCLSFPLAVKYHEAGVNMSIKTADFLYFANTNISADAKEFYTNYIDLLKNYKNYNNKIINLIESHRDLAKKNALNKQLLTTIINGIELLPELNIGEYGQFYKKDWSISYLDKTIEKYVNLLKEFASGIRPIDHRAFDAFINSYLK